MASNKFQATARPASLIFLYITHFLLTSKVSVGRQLLEELRNDEELRKMLAEELIPEALRHRELRRAMLIALSREMATKEDIENFKKKK